MLKFALFFASFLSNIIIVNSTPVQFTQVYINLYTICGAGSALYFLILYSRRNALIAIKFSGASIFLVYTGLIAFNASFYFIVALYPIVLIFNDYIATQNKDATGNTLYRWTLIISALPFIFFKEYFETLFYARVAILICILAAYIYTTSTVTPLPIRSTWKYILFNYVSYYSPLLITTNTVQTVDGMKAWYIFTQAGLVLYLKLLDFKLRNGHNVPKHLSNTILVSSTLLPFVPMMINFNWYGFVTYYCGLLGLIYSSRFINENEHKTPKN